LDTIIVLAYLLTYLRKKLTGRVELSIHSQSFSWY